MIIRLNKAQWEFLGKQAGWIRSAQKQNKYDKFLELMVAKGYSFESPRNSTKCVSYSGSTYPTLISSDGDVKMGYDINQLFMHKGHVWYGDRLNPEDTIILAGIITNPEKRGQGLAGKAIKDFVDAAKQAGLKIHLEPTPMEDFIGKKDKSLNEKELTSWYEKLWFKSPYKDSKRILEL